MSVTMTVTVTQPSPAKSGDTVTAKFAFHGNDGTPETSATFTGTAQLGDADERVATAVVTFPAIPPLAEVFESFSGPGLTFSQSADPSVFTAVLP